MQSTDTWITLLGVRPDGVASAVDLVWGASDTAVAQARAFLAEHQSCEIVEVWADGRQLASVTAALAEA